MLNAKRNKIHSDKFTLAILETPEDFSHTADFDCDHADLNDFFRNDALEHKKELLAETYYFQPKEATEKNMVFPVAFVSLLNDSIILTSKERERKKKWFWDHIKEHIPFPKSEYQSFPSVKIGRLGVHKDYLRQHLGTSLLNMIKEMFLTNNRTGCRFITVDADNKEKEKRAVKFYQKNGFQFLWEKDEDKRTRIMFFDLKRHKQESQ